MLRDYVGMVLLNMRSRQLRSWLTVLGIIIGVAAIVALISVSSGFKFAVEHQFRKMGVSNIRVTAGNLMGPPAGSIGVSNDILERVENLKSVDYVNPVLLDMKAVKYNNEEKFTYVAGYDTKLSEKGFVDMDIDVASGRMFQPGDRYVALIGDNVATNAFDKEVHMKNSLDIGGTKFTVVGIFEKVGGEVDDNIYIPLESARELFGRPDMVNVIVVRLKDGITLADGEREIRHELREELDDDTVAVFTPEQLLKQFTQILDVVQFILVGISAISLIVGAVGIMNSMFTSVLERTGEIGVMKAIGARNSHILLLFLIEAGIIGTVGGALGLFIGGGIAFLVQVIAGFAGFPWLEIHVSLGLVVFALGFSFIIGAIAGLVPALRAAQLNPVDALRYE